MGIPPKMVVDLTNKAQEVSGSKKIVPADSLSVPLV